MFTPSATCRRNMMRPDSRLEAGERTMPAGLSCPTTSWRVQTLRQNTCRRRDAVASRGFWSKTEPEPPRNAAVSKETAGQAPMARLTGRSAGPIGPKLGRTGLPSTSRGFYNGQVPSTPPACRGMAAVREFHRAHRLQLVLAAGPRSLGGRRGQAPETCRVPVETVAKLSAPLLGRLT